MMWTPILSPRRRFIAQKVKKTETRPNEGKKLARQQKKSTQFAKTGETRPKVRVVGMIVATTKKST